ncbi:MAG: SUMF1/EgtB/PvdO family nonheme iron enzyme [Proteobacteria bacterium]|nr:SUMF1/EgtB/PvdO family nonheme iron enzyme [Pseudomonadota bacterium]
MELKQISILSLATLLLLNVLSVQAEESASTPLLNYETVNILPGQYNLYIPILTSFSVEYIKKKITINSGYRIGKYEVTNDQWNKCFQMGGCSKAAEIKLGEAGNHPVVRVNWHDAYQYSRWLTKVSGKTYRLPTEEEWNFAVYQGRDHKEVEKEYDYKDLNPINLIEKRTTPQGTFPANSWGVADYKGNVWEWTLSCWHAAEENILKNHTPTELNSPNACFTRIALGENRSHIPDFITDTYSGGCATLRPAANLGFRLVLEEHE